VARAEALPERRSLVILLAPGTLVLPVGAYADVARATPWQKPLFRPFQLWVQPGSHSNANPLASATA
jgi:hypothetical protein